MDVARILIRTKYCMVLNEYYNISINDGVFMIKVVEDSHGPMRIAVKLPNSNPDVSCDSEDTMEDDDGSYCNSVEDDNGDGDSDSFFQESTNETLVKKGGRCASKEKTLISLYKE